MVFETVDGGRGIQKTRGVYAKINFVLAVQVIMMMRTHLENTGVKFSGVNKLTDHVLR